jgi:hypothetical protein
MYIMVMLLNEIKSLWVFKDGLHEHMHTASKITNLNLILNLNSKIVFCNCYLKTNSALSPQEAPAGEG